MTLEGDKVVEEEEEEGVELVEVELVEGVNAAPAFATSACFALFLETDFLMVALMDIVLLLISVAFFVIVLWKDVTRSDKSLISSSTEA